jgi:hypothetical protein
MPSLDNKLYRYGRETVVKWWEISCTYARNMRKETSSIREEIWTSTYVLALSFLVISVWLAAEQNCQGASIQRVFPADTTRSVRIYADGGDCSRSDPNTIGAFMRGLEHTRYIKINVAYVPSRDRYVVVPKEDLSPELCKCMYCNFHPLPANTSYTRKNKRRIYLLDDMLAFAKTHHASLLIEYDECAVGEDVAKTERTAITEIDDIARQSGMADEDCMFVSTSADTIIGVKADRPAFNVTGRIVFAKPFANRVIAPFHYTSDMINNEILENDIERERNDINMINALPISVNVAGYDVWTCTNHMQVHSTTRIHMTNIGQNMLRAIKFSAATSIETPNPADAVRYARSNGVEVL